MKEIVKKWVADTIETDPFLYGGDNGNAAITARYVIEAAELCERCKARVERIARTIPSVTRYRRKTLEVRPELDHRTKTNDGGHKDEKKIVLNLLDLMEGKIGDRCLDEVRREAEKLDPRDLKGDKPLYHDGGEK